MNCPSCKKPGSRVLNSRTSREGTSVRRRRVCDCCGKRFTTFERLEEFIPWIIKNDRRREPYQRQKVISSIKIACNKRPVEFEEIEKFVNSLEEKMQQDAMNEAKSRWIGEQVMNFLFERDQVAYIRFASVYHSFDNINVFMEVLRMLSKKQTGKELKKHK
jgi:transcriptional repressor NrdR